jgi:hypothetical protein
MLTKNIVLPEKNINFRRTGKNVALILHGQVELGFIKEMCLKAWGIPYNLTKSLVGNVIYET